MAVSTRLPLVANTPLNNLVAIAAAKQLDAQAAWVRAKLIADSITAGGVTTANLEPTEIAAAAGVNGAAYYTLIANAKANADAASAALHTAEISDIESSLVIVKMRSDISVGVFL